MTDQRDTASIAGFYDDLASDYDRMTGFERRFVAERPFFRLLVETNGIGSAIDAGSGTGFHALLLAQLGVNVTAVDLSRRMLKAVSRHSAAMKLDIKTLESSFHDLGTRMKQPVDAVFCMGNSIAHLLSVEELERTLRSFARCLRPGGMLFVQLLNYAKVLQRKQRIQNVRDDGRTVYVRFYDFEGTLVGFNVLRLEKGEKEWRSVMRTIPLKPWLKEDLIAAFERSGFADIRTFGGVAMEPFAPGDSKDLVLQAFLHR